MSWPMGSAAAAQWAAALTAALCPGEPGEPVSAAEVARVLRLHGEPEPIELTEADFSQMRAVAGDLREVFSAPDTATAAGRLNQLLRASAGPPRLTDHGHTSAWHLHVDAADAAPWAQWFAASSAMALATLLTERQAKPGGLCAAQDCGKPFADLGRGAPRRYCSPQCATRTRVSAHRRSRRRATA
jgi:predicted RNA-binding Zn ribbon-like protein